MLRNLTPRRPSLPAKGHDGRPGYVLIAVLVVVVVLSLAAYRFADSMSAEYRAGVRVSDAAGARAAAVSGIHYAAAVLSDRTTLNNTIGNPFNNPAFAGVTVRAGTNSSRGTKFSLVTVAITGPGQYQQQAGVTDEGGKLNVNAMIANDPTGAALYNALLKLPNMTADIAAAVADWVDADDTPGSASGGASGGAENEYYGPIGYRCKNGPLNSIEELLLVKGVTPQLLFGTDQNRNGDFTDDGGNGTADRGWSDYLTVHGRELNIDSTGTLRIYVNGDSLKDIYNALIPAVGDEMAAYIIAFKLGQANVSGWSMSRLDASGNPVQSGGSGSGGKSGGGSSGGKSGDDDSSGGGGSGGGGGGSSQPSTMTGTSDQLIPAVKSAVDSVSTSGGAISSVLDLMNTRITLPKPPGSPPNSPNTVVNSPLNDANRRADLLPALMDKVATKEAVEMVPRINAGTAPQEVLLGLPGLEQTDVDAIIGARDGLPQGDPNTVSGAWIVTALAGVNTDPTAVVKKYKGIEKYVTGSTMVYRVQSVGYLDNGGPVARVEAVIDTNLGNPRILYFRDLTDLDNPRGFQPPKGP